MTLWKNWLESGKENELESVKHISHFMVFEYIEEAKGKSKHFGFSLVFRPSF